MIKKLTTNDLSKTAHIHYAGMINDFLPGFGPKFLETLHKQLISQPEVIHLGFFEKNKLTGFILVTTNTRITMKNTLINGFWKFLPFIIKKILYSPEIIIKIWQTFFYGNQSDNIPTEILILAIDKKYQRLGIGKKLIIQLTKELLNRKIYTLKVGTLSTNVPANKFYRSTGGKYISSFNIYNRIWNKYRYHIAQNLKI